MVLLEFSGPIVQAGAMNQEMQKIGQGECRSWATQDGRVAERRW